MADILESWNGEAVAVRDVPVLPVQSFQQILGDVLSAGGRVVSLFGRPGEGGRVLVTALLADDPDSRVGILSTLVAGRWPSLAAECPAVQAFERELAEQYGVVPEGHPWLKPVRFSGHLLGQVDEYPFFRVEGKEGFSPLIARHRSQTTPHNGQRLLGCTPSELKLIRLEATGDMLVEFVPKFFFPLHAPKAHNR